MVALLADQKAACLAERKVEKKVALSVASRVATMAEQTAE